MGRLLLAKVGPREGNCKLLMDRGYEDGQTRLTARELGLYAGGAAEEQPEASLGV
jgi:hypothetical protein